MIIVPGGIVIMVPGSILVVMVSGSMVSGSIVVMVMMGVP